MTNCSCIAPLAGGAVALALVYYMLSYLKKSKRLDVRGKVVLITGASSGLGEACAHAFYRAGARVILAARRSVELQRVTQDLLNIKLDSETHQPNWVCLDLEDVTSESIRKISEIHGQVDILINNGGISSRSAAMETPIEIDRKLMNTNYFGHVALTKALLPDMIARQSGHILLVSSIQGKIAIPYRSAYSASKHAAQAFFDSLRAEVYHHNVHVTVVNPGYIKTNLSLNAMTASGSPHGIMDSATASGMNVDYVAQEILLAVTSKRSEVTLAPLIHRLAIYIRNICPSLFFTLMKSRAKKQRLEMEKSK